MRRKRWDGLLMALVLVRMGQELGTDSTLARAISAVAEISAKIAGFFPVDRF